MADPAAFAAVLSDDQQAQAGGPSWICAATGARSIRRESAGLDPNLDRKQGRKLDQSPIEGPKSNHIVAWVPKGKFMLLEHAASRRAISYAPLGDQVVYPNICSDDSGRPLYGGSRYLLHFEPDRQPVALFWTLTLHTAQSGEEFSRLGNAVVHNDDGALIILVQQESPAAKRNWLATPEGRFTLSMRFYGPHRSILDGSWLTPVPIRMEWT
jgi:hypothetical protein